MSVKVSNDFSTHTRKDSCRSNNCVSACLCCASANRHSVLSCRRSLIRPMIVPHSCAWQKPSRPFLPACAALQRRLASLNVRKSCACWLKTFWSAKIRLRFVTASPFPRAHLKTKDRALQTAEITFCVRGVTTFQLPTNPGEFGSDCEERAIECRQDAKTRAGGVVSGYSGGRGVFFRRSRGGISVRGLWGRSV